jgi:hypothetical protein
MRIILKQILSNGLKIYGLGYGTVVHSSGKESLKFVQDVEFLDLLSDCQLVIYYSASHSPRNIVRVVGSRRMRWVGHVARLGETRRLCRVVVVVVVEEEEEEEEEDKPQRERNTC